MRKLTACLALVVLFLLAGRPDAQAQTQVDIGPRLGLDLAGDVKDFFVGADVRVTLANLPVLLNGALDIYFIDEPFLRDVAGLENIDADFFQLSFNAFYEIGTDNQAFTPYAGLGLGLSRSSISGLPDVGDASDTDIGVNIIGGATFGFGSLRPFAQAQITVGTPDLFTVGGGLLFKISG